MLVVDPMVESVAGAETAMASTGMALNECLLHCISSYHTQFLGATDLGCVPLDRAYEIEGRGFGRADQNGPECPGLKILEVEGLWDFAFAAVSMMI